MRIKISLCILLCVVFCAYSFAVGENPKKIYTGIFGLWAWGDWDDALKLVKDSGFNIAVGVSTKALLDKADALGIKCIVDHGIRKEALRNEAAWQEYLTGLRTKVAALKDHPAVFAWYVVDEPDGNKIPHNKIKAAVECVRSIDKTKPIFTVLDNPKRWTEYLQYFDIISIDPYLRKKRDGSSDTPEKVRIWIRQMRSDLERSGMKKPVWVVLGAFRTKPRPSSAAENPYKECTPAEFREMAHIAMQEKADGILVWTLSFKNFPKYEDWNLVKDDPELWAAVKNMAKEAGGT